MKRKGKVIKKTVVAFETNGLNVGAVSAK